MQVSFIDSDKSILTMQACHPESALQNHRTAGTLPTGSQRCPTLNLEPVWTFESAELDTSYYVM